MIFFKKTRKGEYNRKVVQQLLDSKVIKEYKSVNDVYKRKGYSKSHISECCNGIRKSAYGYKWQFKEDK